ncbi:MAG: GDP-mannose 4,6-dehydratase, partial [Elusimicrobiota bacterium]|nr:GDP-mannose 4,6-dehydratase [Elusimicrobiota bacterium]
MQFFKDKKIFITGHSGFKGGWLSYLLLQAGAQIKGYALAPDTGPSLFKILNLRDKMQSVFADVRDAEKLQAELTSFAPDIVLHLAAQPLVRRSYKEPVLTIQTNVTGAQNLFEAARKTPSVRVILNITSDKCYENKETGRPYCEGDHLGGFDPYSASKAMSEILTASYRNSFFNSSGA